MKRKLKILLFNWRNRRKNIIIKDDVYVNSNTYLEGNNIIYKGSQINNSFIGYGTYLAHNCKIPNSYIGKYCSIGDGCRIVFGQHPTNKFVSIHPAFYSTKGQGGFTYSSTDIFQEHKYANDEKICNYWKRCLDRARCTDYGRCKIADGSIIGTGAIVTKDTEPFSINVGVPAKK